MYYSPAIFSRERWTFSRKFEICIHHNTIIILFRGRSVFNNESQSCTASLYCIQLVVRRPFCAAKVGGVNHFVIAAAAPPVHCTVGRSDDSRLRIYGKVKDTS